jgi:hypothetical protein
MKAILLALVATFVIGAGANAVLKTMNFSTQGSTSSSSARPDHPDFPG